MNILVRLILTLLLGLWVVLPFYQETGNSNVLGEILSIEIYESILLIVVFFIAVAFYCRTLQTCLNLIKPENRKTKPSSVWYMFAIPFNFIEDFFIVINVSNSIDAEKSSNMKLKDLNDIGLVSGIGWCIAQLLSLIPNTAGQIAGAVAIVLWIIHWRFIVRINKLLYTN
jgi:hypothetical protein